MKRPPYRIYKSKEKEEPKVQIPEEIDTPQAEQLVSDLYKLLHFISKHRAKLLSFLLAALIIGGLYTGYRFYTEKVEMKAAELVDRGIYYLDRGKEEKALSYFERAVKEYGGAPSSRLAKFLIGKIKGEGSYLKGLASSKSYLFSPPSKTTLLTWSLDGGKLPNYKVERQEWTHPEYLYDKLLFALKRGNRKEALNIYSVIKGDYGFLPISSLAERLIK
ncbi:MAG: hypothetical protein ABGX17_02845 [Desulfurobacteriaceae bacterium]